MVLIKESCFNPQVFLTIHSLPISFFYHGFFRASMSTSKAAILHSLKHSLGSTSWVNCLFVSHSSLLISCPSFDSHTSSRHLINHEPISNHSSCTYQDCSLKKDFCKICIPRNRKTIKGKL